MSAAAAPWAAPAERIEAPGTADLTRARIIDAATECFVEYGVGKATINDVGRFAGLSRRTVYRYFENKQALLRAVLDHELQAMTDEARHLFDNAAHFADAAVQVPLALARRVASSPTLSRFFTSETRVETLSSLFADDAYRRSCTEFLGPYIEAAQRSGEIRRDVTPSLVTDWLMHITFSLLGPSPIVTPYDEAAVVSVLQTFFLPGLTGGITPLAPKRASRRRR